MAVLGTRSLGVLQTRPRSAGAFVGVDMRRSGLVLSLLAVAVMMISAGGLASAPAAMAATPRVLVAAYGFDEGSGTTVADASGNGNNGTISNATWAATGQVRQGAAVQRHQRARHDPQRGLAAAVDRDDAGGVGQPLDRQRHLA